MLGHIGTNTTLGQGQQVFLSSAYAGTPAAPTCSSSDGVARFPARRHVQVDFLSAVWFISHGTTNVITPRPLSPSAAAARPEMPLPGVPMQAWSFRLREEPQVRY
ncbi:unnamed protein product [Amoebophrya sp. A120]|nr:unnamed protein product [Amoebophrya sp. A120]|eukprot:GSA120T00020541001.1